MSKNSKKIEAVYNGHANLTSQFTAVSLALLKNYHRLVEYEKGKRPAGINNSEMMFIVHLLSYKWTEREPFAPKEELAKRMGCSKRQVQKISKSLEGVGLLSKLYNPSVDKFAKYDLEPLFKRLEEISAYGERLIEEAA